MTIGALSFLSPWLLTGLIALPIIYWLLRTVPPRPKQIAFPPTRILVGLENREKTPDKTPWWLMLIRLLAAALIIFALAEPILNPNRTANFTGNGPVVAVIDNGWSSGANWPERVRMLERVIDQAERQNRSVVVLASAESERGPLRIEAPNDARTRAAGLLPRPYAPNREAALTRLKELVGRAPGASVVWLSDGVDHGKASAFASGLESLQAAQFMVVEVSQSASPVGLAARIGDGGKLRVNLVRPFGGNRQANIMALSARGEALSEARFQMAPGETRKFIDIELPLELRNQVSRVAVVSERSAGAVHLLDAGTKWSRVALFSGTERDRDQPLLGPLYYVRKAMAPYSEVVEHQTSNLAEGVDRILKRRPSMMILTDVGTIADETAENLRKWVQAGGVLVRFAGPRLEKGGDDLLPVELRAGGRTLGGALSWSTPQP
ncbi:MAG: BatA domain-containing protein, partial [Pseudomonadota bacterium]